MKLEVIIKDKATGEVVSTAECDAVICGYSGSVDKVRNHSGALSTHRGFVFSAMLAIKAAECGIEKLKGTICSKLKMDYGLDMSYEEIEDTLIRMTSSIEIDEDAIKAMMEGRIDEQE